MSVINAIPLFLGDEGYQISRSVRLRSSASAYFNRTPSIDGNRKKWTWSGWVKRGTLGAVHHLMGCTSQSGNDGIAAIYFSGDQLHTYYDTNTTNPAGAVGPAVYRDPSAWYHIVWAVDAANSIHYVYVNNVLVSTDTSKYPVNYDYAMNRAGYVQRIGTEAWGASNYFDGYLTEINFIDGQALTPSSFGETNAVTGVWQPKKYAGTYGTNGFYLNFSDNSAATAAAIGKDYSGNGNNWTPNNISVTAGVTYDSMLDVPTQWADGGNGRGNYCTGNPLIMYNGGGGAPIVPKNGNLDLIGGAGWAMVGSTIAVSTGKWYWEATFFKPGSGDGVLGIHKSNTSLFQIVGYSGDPSGYGYAANGNKQNNSTGVAYGASYTNGDVIGVALDLDAGTLTFYKNNTSQGVAFSSLSGEFFPAFSSETAYFQANFGQRPFAYTPPSGFKALNTLNLPTPTILKGNQYFDVALQTGNTTGRTVSGLAFQPDLVWVKNRAGSTNRRWGVIDSVRGVNKTLSTALTDAEVTSQTDLLTAFNSDGFTIGADAGFYGWNGFAESYAHFTWKEGATQGFDIVTYTGDGVARTIAHNLGVAPKMIIVKNRNTSSYGWFVWHTAFGAAGNTDYINLNLTDAKGSGGAVSMWNNTMPTSSVFSLGTYAGVNGNTNTYVAYLFSEVAGFSKFGSYTGNGTTTGDGPFVFCGFRPRYVMLKNITTAGTAWYVYDSARDTYNQMGVELYPNTSGAEVSRVALDFLSNGFKIRSTASGWDNNANGNTIIFAAFSEHPFKNALAR